jgi:hypothetical protein
MGLNTNPLSLRSLRPGDEVVIHESGREQYRVAVACIKRTYLYTMAHDAFHLDTGRHNGKANKTAMTPARAAKLPIDHARHAIGRLGDVCHSIPDERALAIYETLKEKGLL